MLLPKTHGIIKDEGKANHLSKNSLLPNGQTAKGRASDDSTPRAFLS